MEIEIELNPSEDILK